MEVDSLSDRITNIHQAYFNTSHLGLRDRLFYENINIEEESYIYVCKDNTCSLPFNDISLLKNYL